MKHKAILSLLFFILTPAVLGLCLFSLHLMREPQKVNPEVLASVDTHQENQTGVSIYASLPDVAPTLGEEIVSEDARAEILSEYLTYYKSPLEPYSEFIVEVADKHDMDFRLIVSIAQQESNLCKFIPPESYNCWGWGIHSRGTLGFGSYEEGIETVSAGIKKNYIDMGLRTAEEIMSKYTPSSPGTWARGVNTFMADME